MEKQKKIPNLRFPDFKGEWEVKKLGDIVKINQGLQIPISERLTEQIENSYFYITNEFLKSTSEKKYFIKNPTQSVICHKDDILMTRTGNTGMVVTNTEGAFHNNFFKVAYPDYIIKDYLYYFLKLENTQNLIKKLAGTSTIPDLNHSDFYRIPMAFASLNEQTKISSFLTKIDEKLTALKKKKELLEQYKKGVMQQIFSQELRFKEDDGNDYPEWVKKKIKDISNKKSSNISANKIEDNFGDYIIYGASGVLKKVDFYIEEKDYISIVKDGAGVGRLLFCKGESSVLGTMEIIRPNDGINTYFLYCLLSNIDFVKYITGSTIPHIYFKDYSAEVCFIPCYNEQTKIADFLSSIDNKISYCNSQIEKTEVWKKGLLQQMFC